MRALPPTMIASTYVPFGHEYELLNSWPSVWGLSKCRNRFIVRLYVYRTAFGPGDFHGCRRYGDAVFIADV